MAKVGRAAYNASKRRLEKISNTTESKTLTLAESGEVYAVDLSGAVHCTITLPDNPENGTHYTFIVSNDDSAGTPQNLILSTGSNDRFFLGGVVHLHTGANVVVKQPNGSTHSKLTMTNAEVGTRVDCVSDGTNWFLSGGIATADAPVFATQ